MTPEEEGKRVPSANWLGLLGKARHLKEPEHDATLQSFEKEVERRWQRPNAKHEQPLPPGIRACAAG